MGNDNFTAAPSGTFATRDGYINIAANKQEQWEAVADVLGVPELKQDPRFGKRDARKKNRKALTPLLEEKLKQKDTVSWVEALNAKGVPSGEILTLEAALKQKQVKHRDAIRSIHAEGIGEIQLFNLTAKFSRTPAGVTCPPPRLGAHTNDYLSELGYSDEEIKRLRERGAV
jgi:formyl-CoA transferase